MIQLYEWLAPEPDLHEQPRGLALDISLKTMANLCRIRPIERLRHGFASAQP